METIIDEADLERAGFYWRASKRGVRALSCAPLERDGFTNAFSTRLGGVSLMPHGALNLAGFQDDRAENIHENRRRFLELFDRNWTLATCWQVHGTAVHVICGAKEADDARDDERCDALATNAPNVLLGVKTADCVPVLLGDARTGACASIHAGWRGTLAGIVPRTLARMREEYGTRSADVRAATGPAAGVCCYEVGPEVVADFQETFAEASELFVPTTAGHARIDLQQANRQQLLTAGVAAERIHIAPFCTMCRTDLFFSYRREKFVHGRVGRLLAVIGKASAR